MAKRKSMQNSCHFYLKTGRTVFNSSLHHFIIAIIFQNVGLSLLEWLSFRILHADFSDVCYVPQFQVKLKQVIHFEIVKTKFKQQQQQQ